MDGGRDGRSKELEDGRALVWIDAKTHLRIEIVLCPSKVSSGSVDANFHRHKNYEQVAAARRHGQSLFRESSRRGQERRAGQWKESGSAEGERVS